MSQIQNDAGVALVDELRYEACSWSEATNPEMVDLLHAAADEIERLRISISDGDARIKHLENSSTETSVHLIAAGIPAFGWNHEGVDKLAAKLAVCRDALSFLLGVAEQSFKDGFGVMFQFEKDALDMARAALAKNPNSADQVSQHPDAGAGRAAPAVGSVELGPQNDALTMEKK